MEDSGKPDTISKEMLTFLMTNMTDNLEDDPDAHSTNGKENRDDTNRDLQPTSRTTHEMDGYITTDKQ